MKYEFKGTHNTIKGWVLKGKEAIDPVYSISIDDENGKTIAEVKGAHYGISNEICDANAALFIAAPELLKACIDTINSLEDGEHLATKEQLISAIHKALNIPTTLDHSHIVNPDIIN